MNKKSIRETILLINNAFQFLLGILIIHATVGVIILSILESFAGGLTGIGLAFILPILPLFTLFVFIPSIALGFISFIPGLFGILRSKAKKEKEKQRFLVLNIVGLFICSILSFAGSFGVGYLIEEFFSPNSVLSTIDVIVRLIPIIMLILNVLLLVFTIYVDIPTVSEQNDKWKDY